MIDIDRLLRRLDNSFPVEIIAHPPDVWSAEASLDEHMARAKEHHYDRAFLGRVRSDGTSFWIDEVLDARDGRREPITPRHLLACSTPLSSAIRFLTRSEFALILTGDRVTGVVTRADLNALPVRVMLFTLMTHAEMMLTEAILREYSGDSWLSKLTPSGRETVEALHAKKVKADADTRLVDCASLAYKCDVAGNTPQLVSALGYESKTQFKADRELFVKLRNRLAHNLALPRPETEEVCPEDTLRDALLHAHEFLVASNGVSALADVVTLLRRWIAALGRTGA